MKMVTFTQNSTKNSIEFKCRKFQKSVQKYMKEEANTDKDLSILKVLGELSEQELLEKADKTMKQTTPQVLTELACFANPPVLAKQIIDFEYLLLHPEKFKEKLEWKVTSKNIKKMNILMQNVLKPDYKISEEQLKGIRKFITENKLHQTDIQLKAKKVSTASEKILSFCLVIFCMLEKRK